MRETAFRTLQLSWWQHPATKSSSMNSVTVTAGAGCGWAGTSNDSWIAARAQTGTAQGNGLFTYRVAQNKLAGCTRAVKVGNQTRTVTQAKK
jgi:hypothetical protein